ncbi:antibiotic biosynthesis monooxygenase family protein [Mycobacterium avium]|uniref:Monooxygenase n=1 Tax=Mycobacterium avium (strain 104) TaxID=243243 RepID=A0A0H2ZR41_MYCA1|nr:antibiotic biosynthesis monooxygenase family protein [Mycobacterium avium]ABK64712.1 monooxygenase [Mycobacterium avium 104]KDP08955.1 hypothetical protein MAV101_02465 [Mycobacterium avium subsp. hominissuis 101]MCG3242814.1 antibiotic biosynthesis monooxygenase [Mycobacterium avium subsp. hominissuis]
MTQPEPVDEPVTFVNIFEIPAEQVDDFIAAWRARSRLMADAPGHRGAELLRATSPTAEFQLINVSRWDSMAAHEAATARPQYQQELQAFTSRPDIDMTPHRGFYRVAAITPGHAVRD